MLIILVLYYVSLAAMVVTLISTLASFSLWRRILGKVGAVSAGGARYFLACFALCLVGQVFTIAQKFGVVFLDQIWGVVPVYCFALAAVIFAVGSAKQLKSAGGSE